MRDDGPDEHERRAIDRHPLTQRLNRELIECFRRLGSAHLEKQGLGNDAALGGPVDRE